MGTRYLIDSNILIEFVAQLLPQEPYHIVTEIIDEDFIISFISKIEVLGHHTADEAWNNFINRATTIHSDDKIAQQTIKIRKERKVKLPDAIIAATAIVNDLTLLTRNTSDFKS